MADKPTLIMKVSGKDDKFAIVEKDHPHLMAALRAFFETHPNIAGLRVRIEGRD